MSKEAMKLALEALEVDPFEMVEDANGHMVFLTNQAITALREALADHSEQHLDMVAEQPAPQKPIIKSYLKKDNLQPVKWSDYEPDGMHHNKPQKRPQNCGTGYCSCIECVMEPAQQEPVLQDIEQYRLQMAGISTAAIGYWKESDGIHPDYDTIALRDVAKLYAKYDELYRAQRNPLTDIYRSFEQWKSGNVLEHGVPRTEHYSEAQLDLVEMGWNYGYDAGRAVEQALDKKAENARELGLDYEPAQQEPVTVVKAFPMGHGHPDVHYAECQHLPSGTKLYTSPPAQSEWVGLTDEKMADYLGDRYHSMTENELEFFRLGEALYGIKEQL